MSDPNQVFQAPPPPPFAPTPPPPAILMSTPATLMNVFFEPSQVFEALRSRPRFLIAGIILFVLTIIVTVVLFMRVDMGELIRAQMDKSSRAATQTEQQKELGVKIGKAVFAVGIPASVPVIVAAGAGLYLLMVMAFGGVITYRQSVSVWVYSSLPPAVLRTIVAVLVLFLKTPDNIDPEHLLVTNPGAFMQPESAPVLTALLTQFDLLRFYGMFLAAIGLRKVAKLSAGAAWAIVIGFWLILAVLAVAKAAITGS